MPVSKHVLTAPRGSAITACLAISAALWSTASVAATALPNVSGTWTGKTSCPTGPANFSVVIKGESGTFTEQFSGAKPRSFPVEISAFTGAQGIWIRVSASQESKYYRGLLSKTGNSLQMEGVGACYNFGMTRQSTSLSPPPAGSTTQPTPPANPWLNVDGFAPSRSGPPNSDAIIYAQINELVALASDRTGPRKISQALSLRGDQTVQLEFHPYQNVACTLVRRDVYDCSYVGRPSMSSQMAPLNELGRASDTRPAPKHTDRFERVSGVWRSSTYRQKRINDMGHAR